MIDYIRGFSNLVFLFQHFKAVKLLKFSLTEKWYPYRRITCCRKVKINTAERLGVDESKENGHVVQNRSGRNC